MRRKCKGGYEIVIEKQDFMEGLGLIQSMVDFYENLDEGDKSEVRKDALKNLKTVLEVLTVFYAEHLNDDVQQERENDED